MGSFHRNTGDSPGTSAAFGRITWKALGKIKVRLHRTTGDTPSNSAAFGRITWKAQGSLI